MVVKARSNAEVVLSIEDLLKKLLNIVEEREVPTDPYACLNVTQAASYLGVSKQHVYKLAAEAQIPCRKIGSGWRFDPEALRQYVNGEYEFEAFSERHTRESQLVEDELSDLDKEYDELLGRQKKQPTQGYDFPRKGTPKRLG